MCIPLAPMKSIPYSPHGIAKYIQCRYNSYTWTHTFPCCHTTPTSAEGPLFSCALFM